MTSTIESLLRDSSMTHGRIQLYRSADGWSATIAHFAGHMTHDGAVESDPVAVLRAALIEDERRSCDLARRYSEAVRPAAVPDFGDLLG